MNKTKYVGMVLALLTMTACSNDENLTETSWQNDPNAVKFHIEIAEAMNGRSNPASGDIEKQKVFNNGDQVTLTIKSQDQSNEISSAVYKFEGQDWKPAVEKQYVSWITSYPNEVCAVYPAKETLSAFILPTDQSDETKISGADYMTCSMKNVSRTTDVLNIKMKRQTARVIVKMVGFSKDTELKGNLAVTVTGNTMIEDGVGSTPKEFQTFAQPVEGVVNSTYTALVAPMSKEQALTGKEAAFITVNTSNKKYTVKGYRFLEAGKTYTYSMTIGKDKATINSVQVTDWTGGTAIDGGSIEKAIKADPKTNTIITKQAGHITQEMLQQFGNKLIIQGPINGTDLKWIRQAAGCPLKAGDAGNRNADASLKELDLSNASIVEGGDPYINNDIKAYTTLNNHIGESMFEYAALTSIILPEGLTDIDKFAFRGAGIKSLVIPATVTKVGQEIVDGMSALTSLSILGTPAYELSFQNFSNSVNCNLVIPATWTDKVSVDAHGNLIFEDKQWKSVKDQNGIDIIDLGDLNARKAMEMNSGWLI